MKNRKAVFMRLPRKGIILRCAALFCATLLLSACSRPALLPQGESEAASDSSGADSAAVSSAPASSLPASGAPAPQDITPEWGENFRQQDFLDFMSYWTYARAINFVVDGAEPLQAQENAAAVCGLMCTYLYGFATQRQQILEFDPEVSQVIYPLATMQQLAREMFGFAYDFEYPLSLSQSKQAGYLTQLYPENWNTLPYVQADTVSYADGVITVEVDYWQMNGNGNYPVPQETRRFTFAYAPENTLCPYTLQTVESAGVLITPAEDLPAPQTAGVAQPDLVYVRPPLGRVFANGGLNLRKGPGFGNDSILVIPDSAYIEVVGVLSTSDADWLYLSYNGEHGWASREYLYPDMG